MLHLQCSFKILMHVFAFLCVKANSKQNLLKNNCSFSSRKKVLIVAVLVRLKANYMMEMHADTPSFLSGFH